MKRSDSPGHYSGRGDPRRDLPLSALDAEGPLHCYGCGAYQGTPHSPECNIYRRGNQPWAKDAEAITAGGTAGEGDKVTEHKMISRPGQRGWQKG